MLSPLAPTAALAPRVLAPGDPGRALALAQLLLQAPAMFNHRRGLWGYTGIARADGAPLSIQSTGLGGPSTALVAGQLVDLGARAIVRVGTCRALASRFGLGDLIWVGTAICGDGASQALGATGTLQAGVVGDAGHGAGERPVASVLSVDVLPDPQHVSRRTDARADLLDLSCAALFALAARRGIVAGAVLIVTDVGMDQPELEGEALVEAEAAAGQLALSALSSGSVQQSQPT